MCVYFGATSSVTGRILPGVLEKRECERGYVGRMLADERYVEILELLKGRTILRTQDIIEHLGVSRETVRRDLNHLEEKGLVRRVYGGITSVRRALDEPPYDARESANADEKRAIGKVAADLVRDGEVVILDGGTTVMEVARNLHRLSQLTVLTNSLRAAQELTPHPSISVYMLGGRVRQGDVSTSGYLAESGLRDFHVDKAIIGAGGVSPEEGVTDYHEPEARLRRMMTQRAGQVIVVADHTKLGVVAFVNCCEVKSIDVCVTSRLADDQTVKALKAKGVEVIFADFPKP